jgi:ParB-like chromosome segregation protein Spo0J
VRHLATLDLDVELLQPYPGNARKGDLAAIAQSLKSHGQYRAIIVQAVNPDKPELGGTILAGNHTYLAATQKLEYASIRADVIDCDDIQARKIVLVDNRLSDKATYDQDALARLVDMAAEDGGLDGTGFSDSDLAKLLGESEPVDAPIDSDLDVLYGVTVQCDDEDQQTELLERLSGEGFTVRAMMR